MYFQSLNDQNWLYHIIGTSRFFDIFGLVLIALLIFTFAETRKNKKSDTAGIHRFQAHIIICLLLMVLYKVGFIQDAAARADRPLSMDYHLTFYRRHLHIILGLTIFLGCLHMMFPKVLKFRLNSRWAWIQTVILLIGVLCIICPSLRSLLSPPPLSWLEYPDEDEYDIYNLIAELGFLIALIGAAALIALLVEGLIKRRPVKEIDVSPF